MARLLEYIELLAIWVSLIAYSGIYLRSKEITVMTTMIGGMAFALLFTTRGIDENKFLTCSRDSLLS